MKRNLLWLALAIAIAAWIAAPRYDNLAVAQTSADTAAGAEADAQSDAGAEADAGAQADTAADANADQAGEASATATNESSADQQSAQSDTEATASSDTAAGETSTEASGSAQATTGEAQDQADQQPLPAPDQQDASAPDQDAAPQRDDRAQADQRQPADRADASADAQADADANVQGRRDTQDRRGRDGDRRGRRDRNDFRAHIHFGAATRGGLTINTVTRDSIFFRAGLRQGDVLVSIDGRPIRGEADFHRWVVYEPGRRVPVVVLRDGRRETIYIVYEDDVADAPLVYDERPAAEAQAFLGVVFDAQNANAAVVVAVTPDSPAEHAGLQRGDMIIALNGQPVSSYRDAIEMINSLQPGDRLGIDFSRRVDDQTQAILAGRPGPGARAATLPPREVRRYRDVPQDAPPASDVDIEVRRDNENRGLINRGERQSGPRPLLPRLRN